MNSFQCVTEYGEYSSTISCVTHDPTIAKAKALLFRDISYYIELGRPIRAAYIVELCEMCGGKGTIFKPYKRRTRGILGKDVVCPKCKGVDSAVTVDQWR